MLKTKNIWLGLLLVAISLSWACDAATGEANKLVDEGNALIKKNNEMTAKSSALIAELLGDKMTKAEDLEKYKADNKAKFDELVTLCDQLEKGQNEAAAKFEQASAKLKAGDKFQEYTSVKAQEFKKRAEWDKATGTFVKAFLAEKDAEKADALVGGFNKTQDTMKKEADGLMEKAEKIVKDNPTMFEKK